MSRQYRRQLQRQIRKLLQRNRPTRVNRRARGTLDFAPLEPRQLLAIVSTPVPDGTNLVVNGDFETVSGTGPQFDADDVNGWNVSVGVNDDEIINLFNTTRAGNLLELDSTADVEDRIFQDVPTSSGQEYVLAFDMRSRDAGADADEATNFVDVFWDGSSLGTYSADTMWQTFAFSVEGLSETSRLEFREVVSGNDGIGPLIDNVRVIATSEINVGNGSFESATNSAAPFFEADSVDSWRSAGDAESRLLNIVNDGGASTGSNYLNLETTADHIDRVYQDIATTSGSTYYVMFDLRGDSSATDSSNEIRIRWNDRWAGTFEGGDEWQSFGILVNSDSDTSRLVFRESGDSEGSGPFLDNVRVMEVSSIPDVVNDLVVDLNPSDPDSADTTANFAEGGEPAVLFNDILLEHPSNRTLTEARVKIDSLPDGADEVLAVDVGDSGLSSAYDAEEGRLVIQGEATIETYASVLKSVTYENTATNPTTTDRSISVAIYDSEITTGRIFSNRVFSVVSITGQNNAPTIEQISDVSVAFGNELSIDVSATDPDGEELVYDIETSGNAGSRNVTINNDGLISWTNFTSDGEIDVTVTVEDESGLTATTDFTITASGFTPFSGNGELAAIAPADRNGIYGSAPEMTIDTSQSYEAVINTDVGEIRIELFDDEAPITVNNFVNLAEDGFYDGVDFHRVIQDFVAQGGDPLGTGTGGPGYQFEDEFVDSLRFTGRGQLAMANSGPTTNGSQFFITYEAQPHLNDFHTIFGQVVGGDATLDAISLTDPPSGNSTTVINSIDIVVT